MGASQQKLAVAERHHKKVVNKIRKQAAAFLEDESNVYGKYLGDYSAELAKATDELNDAVQVAKAGLAKAEAVPSTPNDWKDPAIEQRAKLGAQVASAERVIKKAERRRARSVREAEEQGEETMEDEAQKLGMKLGDMTPLVDQAKKTLEAVAEKAPVVVAKTAVKTDAKADTKKVDIKALQDKLAKASKKVTSDTADLNKKLEGFLSKTGKDVADKTAKLKADLDGAQKVEIEKVLGRKQEPAKAAPVSKHHTPVPSKPSVKLPVPHGHPEAGAASKHHTPVPPKPSVALPVPHGHPEAGKAVKVEAGKKVEPAKAAPVVKAVAAKVTVAKK